jgi:hypothetical protein
VTTKAGDTLMDIPTPRQLFDRLFEPFPDEVVKERKQQGQNLTYAEWYVYVARANKEMAPLGFSSEIRSMIVAGEYLYIVVRVTDHNTNRHHDGLGLAPVEKSKSKGFGGAGPEAYSQALRRAFAMYGMGLNWYMEDGDIEWVLSEGDDEGNESEEGAGSGDDTDASESQGSTATGKREGETEGEGEEAGDEPTTKQLARLEALGKLCKDEDIDVSAQRRKLSRDYTKRVAGLVIREMKKLLEDEGIEWEEGDDEGK